MERRGGEGRYASNFESKPRSRSLTYPRFLLLLVHQIVLLSNPTNSDSNNSPIDTAREARIQEIFKGDFLDDADDLVARSDFKGLSGAVFRDLNERRVVSTMWKKASIARAGLVSFHKL